MRPIKTTQYLRLIRNDVSARALNREVDPGFQFIVSKRSKSPRNHHQVVRLVLGDFLQRPARIQTENFDFSGHFGQLYHHFEYFLNFLVLQIGQNGVQLLEDLVGVDDSFDRNVRELFLLPDLHQVGERFAVQVVLDHIQFIQQKSQIELRVLVDKFLLQVTVDRIPHVDRLREDLQNIGDPEEIAAGNPFEKLGRVEVIEQGGEKNQQFSEVNLIGIADGQNALEFFYQFIKEKSVYFY